MDRAFSNTDPLFQNPFAKPAPAVQDLGDLPGPPVGAAPPPPDAPPGPTKTLEPVTIVGEPERKIRSYLGGGGGGAKPNPDPYGIDAADQGAVQAFRERADALRRAADGDAVKAVQIAQGQHDLSRMQAEDAAIAAAEAQLSQQHFDDGMKEIGRQLDDVRARKIDPLRQFKESPALGVMAVLGGALSGFYQGITGGQHNEFLTDLDRQIDRGIAEDQRQIDTEKWAIGEGGNFLAQQRAVQKETQLATLQARNLTYEAAKQDLEAKATEAGGPAERARADAAISVITLAQKQLEGEIARRKQAQAAAAGAQAYARQKEVQNTLKELYTNGLKEGLSPEQAMQAARSVVDTLYLGGGHVPLPKLEGAGGITREHLSKMAVELHETTREATGILDAIRSFDPKKVAAGGLYGSVAPNVLMTQSQKSERDERERYNSLVRPAVGAAWRLQTHGVEPKNPHLLDEQAKAFMTDPSDQDEDAARKMKNLEQHMINAAKSGGVELPDARPSAKTAADLGVRPVR
ncbi:MAG TPA: hypothetical protein VFN70_18160 [Burkholderiales bacterium]|nr:hypothetical protein [Burkholderiales bacterium]